MQWIQAGRGTSMGSRLTLGNRYVSQALEKIISNCLRQRDPSEELLNAQEYLSSSSQRDLFQYISSVAFLRPGNPQEDAQLWRTLGWESLRNSVITTRAFAQEQSDEAILPRYSQDLVYSWAFPYYRQDSLTEIAYQSGNQVRDAITREVLARFPITSEEINNRILVGVVLQRYPKETLTGTPADYYEQTNCRSAIVAYDIYTGRLEQITEFDYGISSGAEFFDPETFRLNTVPRSNNMLVMGIGTMNPPTFNYPLGI